MRISQKQLSGYLHAHKDFISQNDTYNKEHFGITKHEYDMIRHAVVHVYGLDDFKPVLSEVNRELAGL
jgi:hypothetical protein